MMTNLSWHQDSGHSWYLRDGNDTLVSLQWDTINTWRAYPVTTDKRNMMYVSIYSTDYCEFRANDLWEAQSIVGSIFLDPS